MSAPRDEEGRPLPLTKGLEEEVYTGTAAGDVKPLSGKIAADLQGYTTEPDGRNVEFTTAPYRDYQTLVDRLMAKRCQLRRHLAEKYECTLIPFATLSLDGSQDFLLSKEGNPYYEHIRATYGTRVVTASTHINLGIDDIPELFRAYRVLRCEAALFLALTAASPFLHGDVTGHHSTRWVRFPHTPERVPFFCDHDEFVAWVEARLAAGDMYNPRHLWVSIRPNGDESPHSLNRLELRICDRISDPVMIAAVTALYEARVLSVLADPTLDPLHGHPSEELIDLTRRNEENTANQSLDARVVRWHDARELSAREWIAELLEELEPIAREYGFAELLTPIGARLEVGSPAQRWLRRVAEGATPRECVQEAIVELAERDRTYDPDCPAP